MLIEFNDVDRSTVDAYERAVRKQERYNTGWGKRRFTVFIGKVIK